MNKFYLILIVGLYLLSGSIAHADDDVAGVESSQKINSERILVLYDNPMEEHTVLSVLEVRGYDIKVEKQRNAAIRELKKQAANIKAHAIIVLSLTKNESGHTNLSAKAIRYKHFYY